MQKQNINLDKSVKASKIFQQRKVYWFSKFNFLNQHNGLRPNKMHLFVAPTHVGKSTVTHAIINDLATKNEGIKILLYLTEETKEDFESALSNFADDFNTLNKSITVVVEDKSKSDDEIKNYLETLVVFGRYDLFFVDNITTSKLYMDRKTSTQSEVSIWLKSLLEDTTLFLIAHTNGNNYNNEILDETHIRGSKTITNITEFLYVMQPVRVNNSLHQFIRIIKHRGQSPDNKFFRLFYNPNKKTIDYDTPCSFDDFKSVFKLRNKL